MDLRRVPVGPTVMTGFVITYGAGKLLEVLPESTPPWVMSTIAMIGISPLFILALIVAFAFFSLGFLILWGVVLILHRILPGRAWRVRLNEQFPIPGRIASKFAEWLLSAPSS